MLLLANKVVTYFLLYYCADYGVIAPSRAHFCVLLDVQLTLTSLNRKAIGSFFFQLAKVQFLNNVIKMIFIYISYN